MFGKKVTLALILAVLLLCIIALNISAFLVAKHAPIKTQAAQEALKHGFLAEMCSPEDDTTFDCDAVVTDKKHGYVRFPMFLPREIAVPPGSEEIATITWKWRTYSLPVAHLGMAYYIFLMAWFVFTGIPKSKLWHMLPLLMGLAGVLAAFYFIYIMGSVLGKWCMLCLTLHAIDFVLLALLFLILPYSKKPIEEADAKAPPARDSALPTSHALAAIVCALAIALLPIIKRHEQLNSARAYQDAAKFKKAYANIVNDKQLMVAAYHGTKRVRIPVREGAPVMGPASAPNELIIFSDLQCPMCRGFEDKFKKEILPLWRGQLRLVFRHYPLCSDCNQYVSKSERRPHGKHPNACLAAEAAEAAKLQGGDKAFWKMHDVIMHNQGQMRSKDYGLDTLVGYAKEMGLDIERFKIDINQQKVQQIIVQDISHARKVKVGGTPTLFLNGRRISSIQRNSPVFWKTLADILQPPVRKP